MGSKYENWFANADDGTLDSKLKLAAYLWHEYKYRHEHCWNLTFKFTLTVVSLGSIPYVNKEVVEIVPYLAIISPLLSIAFSLLSYKQLNKELEILDHVKSLYRSLQDAITFSFHRDNTSTFKIFVLRYIQCLVAAAILNFILVIIVWMPKVLDPTKSHWCRF